MHKKRKIKLVYFGTPEFSVKPLLSLINSPSDFEIQGVITQPDKPAGRKQTLLPSPVKLLALEHGLSILQPDSLKNNIPFISLIKDLRPDFIITAAYGKILPRAILEIPKYFCINIHASLLPRYRGASPVEQALLNGDPETGVTFIKMDEGMDTGDILLIQRLKILPEDNNVTLRDRLSILASGLLPHLLHDITDDIIHPIPQNNAQASYSKKIEKKDGEINPKSEPAVVILNKIRALNPWPSTFVHAGGKRLKVLSAEQFNYSGTLEPGTYMTIGEELILSCKSNTFLKLNQIQLEGKNASSAQDFLRGHPNFFNRSPAR